MNIYLNIERVIVNGVTDGFQRTDVLQKAIAAELTRLVREQGLPQSASGMRSQASGGSILPSQQTSAGTLGQQIAQGIYQGIRNAA